MAVTGTSVMSDAVQALYQDDYLDILHTQADWTKFVKWQARFGGMDLKGSSYNFPVGFPLDRVTSDASETSDVTPVEGKMSNVSVSIVERLNAIQKTALLDIKSYADQGRIIAGEIARNQIDSISYYISEQVLNGGYTVKPGVATRVAMNTTSHLPTYQYLMNLAARVRGFGTPSYDDGTFVAPVPPCGIAELQQIAEVEAVAEYSDPSLIYDGKSKLSGARFPNERFKIGNIRFVESLFGKVYLGAGTPLQAATTITADAAAGATQIAVAESTGLTAGDFITIGTVESGTTRYPTTEQVLITAASASSGAATLTIQGAGNTLENEGLRYAHVSGTAVVEAPNVFAIPVLGPESIVGLYSSVTGVDGLQDVHPHQGVVNGRFWDYTWWWIGGVKGIPKFCVRGEFATRTSIYGDS